MIKVLFLKKWENEGLIKQCKTDISVKMLQENAQFFAKYIYLQYNEALRSSNFANFFKFANIAAAIKQGSRNQKDNYRSMVILPLISNIFE